jgi:hypothetical protein
MGNGEEFEVDLGLEMVGRCRVESTELKVSTNRRHEAKITFDSKNFFLNKLCWFTSCTFF